VLDAFIGGLLNVFTWPTFGLMLLGIVVGFWVGILPGLGGPVTLAIMLPFTFDMKPTDAFAFLLGMNCVISTTGDVSSILFGVPGETTSAALIVDGHEMAKRGEAGRALGAALTSSLVGALLGAFGLALAIPIVSPLVFAMASPEFLMLAVLGICLVGILSSGSPLKGVIAGGLGLMLAMIGMEQQSSIQRYTFGLLSLWDGIGLVPVTVGIFAIPEIVDLAIKGTSIAQQRAGKLGGVWQGVKDTFIHWGLTLRCSLLGTFLGILPGLGGSACQWLAYAHAVQSSPKKERFGKGAIEGVLGPGAANNSVLGGALITTVAFGLPGTVVMAILLGAFLIQGIVPGPSMLNEHLPLTMSFVWIIVVANIITVAFCFLFLAQIARATFIRGGLLIPVIVVLVFVGAYAEKNAMLDLVTTLFFGLVGLVMVHLGWPRPPLVLGLVLGSLVERYLFLATARYGTDWLTRPIVLVLIALAVAVVLYSFVGRKRLALADAG
jgi:putative tricarboxylic transport membrane protein